MAVLSGKRALVCGSTRGIGRACALRFAEEGAEVTLLGRDEPALAALVAELAASSPSQRHDVVVADHSAPAALEAGVARHLRTSSERGPIHILVNNTGGPPAGPILDAGLDAFVAAFEAHLLCNQILAQLLVPGMKEAEYGRIVNVVSTSVRTPLPGLGVSNTIRAAVAGWAKTLSNEIAKFGITVNNILPGATATDRLRSIIASKASSSGLSETEVESKMLADIPARRFGRAEEIAAAAVFLASPHAAYVTGISLPVDGGRTACL